MRILTLAISLMLGVAPLAADLVEQGPKDSEPSGLLAGAARADITPPSGIAQMNWGSQTHIEATGVDPVRMKATALVLSNGQTKFAMVDIDCLRIQGLEPAIEIAARKTGIPATNIRLAASHTHAGPMVSPVKGPPGVDLSPYRDLARRHQREVIEKIAAAVAEADSKLEPAHIYGSRGTGSININRRVRAGNGNPPAVGRNPDGFIDRELIVFRIDNAKGKPLAVIANFQCHGTVLAYENEQISPDWMGMTRKVVEQALPGALCLYFQGAAGNQGPIEGFTGDLSVAHRLGSILGHEIAALALGIETVRREPTFEGFVESTAYQAKQHWRVQGPRDAKLRMASAMVDVPRRRYSAQEIAGMERRLDRARRQLEDASAVRSSWQSYQASARVRRFTDLLEKWKRPADPSPARIRLRALRVGDLAIVSMPGEPFAEIGAAVKQGSPFEFTMFCGYSDGAGGDYLPTASEYRHGGYEVERTPYGPGADTIVIDAARSLLAELVE